MTYDRAAMIERIAKTDHPAHGIESWEAGNGRVKFCRMDRAEQALDLIEAAGFVISSPPPTIIWHRIDGPYQPPRDRIPGGDDDYGLPFVVWEFGAPDFEVARFCHCTDQYVLRDDGEAIPPWYTHWASIALPTPENTER